MAAKLLLIDASSYIFRAFYALPSMSNAAGVPTNATLGFINMLRKTLREIAPEYAIVVWDAPGAKRRKQLYPDYKATRDATPEDLRAQFANIRRLVEAQRVAALEFEGEEADDAIATLTRLARAQGLEVDIVSTDKDLMQLVDAQVTLVDTMKDRRIGPAEVEERFGVPPERVLDLRALVGDSSDNIPGVKGVGEKTATELIQQFGTLDALLERSDEIKQKGRREKIQAGADMARLSRELSHLRDDLPLELDLDSKVLGEPDDEALRAIFKELEFSRLLEAMNDAPGSEAASGAGSPASTTVTLGVANAEALADCVKTLAETKTLAASAITEPSDPMRGEWIALVFADSIERAWSIDVRSVGTEALLEAVRGLFEDAERCWLGHELKQLCLLLGRNGVAVAGTLLDSAVAAYVDNPSQQVRKPEVLARSYLGVELASEEEVFGKGAKRRSADEVPPEELAAFHGPYLATALELLPKIEAHMESTGQDKLFREIEVPLVRVLADMELTGVRIDEDRLRALSTRLSTELAEHEARIYALAGGEFNIGSPKQLQQILFEKLALPPTKKTKTGFSTDESVLEELSVQGHELPGEILHYRRTAKLKSTYVDALPEAVNPQTGRIHGSFNQTVAATGRLSSTHPNLQNIPIRTPAGQEIRAAFVPAEGHCLLSADYSQIELRILAHLSQDESLVTAFREGADIHVRTASQVFGVAPEDVSDEQRSRTKAINFGIIYGQSSFGLARNLGIAQAEAKAHIDAYFERYPGVKRFLSEAVQTAKQAGYAQTINGRRRYLPDLHSKNRVLRQAAERMATNSVIQGTAADYLKIAMVEIWKALQNQKVPSARMILTVHDELVFEVRPDEEPELRSLVAGYMQNVGQLSVPLEVHLGCGKNWLEAH